MVSGAGPPDGEILEVVDLTQDQPPSMRGVDSDLVDLSQLSSGDEEESFRPPPSLTETKALYRGGTGISRLLEVERDLRDRLLQCQEPIATTAKAGRGWRNGGWRNGGWRNGGWRNGGWRNGRAVEASADRVQVVVDRRK